MAYSIKGMTRKELERLKGQIDKQLDRLDAQDKKQALAAAQKAAKAHGFDLSELAGGSAAKPKVNKPKKSGKPKYANPANSSQTWTGKGRQPQWFKDAIGSGKKAEDLAI